MLELECGISINNGRGILNVFIGEAFNVWNALRGIKSAKEIVIVYNQKQPQMCDDTKGNLCGTFFEHIFQHGTF